MSAGRWCCVVLWLAAVVALSLLSYLLPSTTSWRPSSRRPTPMAVHRNYPPHLTLNKDCYVYSKNVTARNTCCTMYRFTEASETLKCIEGSYKELIKQRRQKTSSSSPWPESLLDPSWSFTNSGSIHNNTYGVHWALVGDSHLRYIFDVILHRMAPSDLQYSLESFKGDWRDVLKLLDTMRFRGHAENMEVRHLHVPFYITWYYDRLLKKLPRLVKQWETGEQLKPSLLIIDTGLHWMKEQLDVFQRLGQTAAVERFRDYLRSLAPELTRLATSTTTVYKLLDDLQAAEPNSSKTSPFTVSNFELYNSMARQALEGTGVIVWDSTVPLSRLYTRECRSHPKTTPFTFWWKCMDKRHVGYLVVEQYVDMLLNDVCNRHMDLGAEYCV